MDGRHVQADCLQVDLKPASDVLAGAVARAASQGTIHPLDTLKVRMQHSSTTNTLSKFGRLVPPAGDPPGRRSLTCLSTKGLSAQHCTAACERHAWLHAETHSPCHRCCQELRAGPMLRVLWADKGAGCQFSPAQH